MTHAVFKLVYFIELVLISLARRAVLRRTRRLAPAVNYSTFLDTLLLYISSFANLMPLIYVFTPWLDFANYDLPALIGWLGAIIFALAGLITWKTQKDLGRNWTPSLAFRDGHYLVKDGIFEYLRHPLYAAHLLTGIAQMLMLHNWIAGYAYLITVIPRILVRIREEERMMLDKFGDEYRDYLEKTGGLIPKIS